MLGFSGKYGITHAELYDRIWDEFHSIICKACGECSVLEDCCPSHCENKADLNSIQKRHEDRHNVPHKPIYESTIAILTKDQLADREKLCTYCNCTNYGEFMEASQVRGTADGYTSCEGMYCDDAYQYYLEHVEEEE